MTSSKPSAQQDGGEIGVPEVATPQESMAKKSKGPSSLGEDGPFLLLNYF
jgi:hypothetical protein